jgi:hypothetical protein
MKDAQGVKGIRGYCHITNGRWVNHNTLKTLCGRSISPNYRDIPIDIAKIDCPFCKAILEKRQPECEFCGGRIGG